MTLQVKGTERKEGMWRRMWNSNLAVLRIESSLDGRSVHRNGVSGV